MNTIYHVSITAGIISYDHAPAPRAANEYHAPNAKQYFAKRGMPKPEPVAVRGWPFAKMYVTHGSQENGNAVAWS